MVKKFVSVLITFIIMVTQISLNVNALECESFVYDFINEKIIITNYTGVTEGTITIPNKIEGKEVLEIGEKAFYGLLNKNSTVVISDNISIINDYAFTGLIGIGMNAIYIPKSIEYIGKYSIGYTYYPNSNMQTGCVDDQYKAYPVKIYGYPGTVAETYAKENGFAFITLNDDFILGDVNDDGAFNISDVVLLQKWLLAVPDTHLANWKTADFCADDRLDVFDLCLMKRALIEQQRQITVEDIISLSKKGYDLTVADFAPFKGEDIGSGLCVMKYEVTGKEDRYYLLVGHDGTSEKPVYAKLVNIEKDGKWDETDIRSEEFQNAVEIYENWNKGTDTEENKASARKLGDYALEMLKNGTYSLDTVIDSENASELMDEETAALMDKDEFTDMEFMDEHTVMMYLNYGFLGVHGYLVTDGTVSFELDTQVSVQNKFFDGNVINIEWADGNLYYFTAGL